MIFETLVFFKFTGLMHNFLLKLPKNIDYSQLDKGWTFRQCPDFIFDSHCFKNTFKLYPNIASYHKICIIFLNSATTVTITSLLLGLIISTTSEFTPLISLYKLFFFLFLNLSSSSGVLSLLFSASSTHIVSSVH